MTELSGHPSPLQGHGPADHLLLPADLSPSVTPYLPPPLLGALSRGRARPAAWIEPLEGTLLFSDLSGFTQMSERLAQVGREGAERLTEIINAYFATMLDIAREHGGANLKFGGDALLLLFTGVDHPARAVRCAIAMQRATRSFGPMRAGTDTVRLKMSVGVHSGTFWSAAAGVPGVRMQHFILGPEASRVAAAEAVASAGEVFASMPTIERLPRPGLGEGRGEFRRVLRLRNGARGYAAPAPSTEAGLPADVLAYLPPPIAERLATKSEAAGMESEHRKVTVTFIELLGLNEVLERGAGELLADLQEYMSRLVPLVGKYGGFLASNDISAHGLKLIVLFGAPVAHEEDPANAFRLAADLNREIPATRVRLQHRIGINSGYVFAADVGSDFRREYTVMGDAVNLAARLMAAAQPWQVLASARTAAEAGPRFLVEHLPPIWVKGKAQPIAVCSAVGERPPEAAVATGDEGSLVGREREIESMRELCREVEGGRSRSLLITGEAGIGKSHLARECEGYLRARGWNVLRGQASPRSTGDPFAPWVQVLGLLFGLGASQDPDERTEAALPWITPLPRQALEVAALLNPLLNLALPETDLLRSLDAEARRRRLFDLVTALLEAAAARSPVAVLIEDLHWADPSSIHLLNHLDATLRASPLLLCLTQRPREVGLQLRAESGTELALPELLEEQALHLLRRALGRPDLPDEVAFGLLSRARGNPLFLEELGRSLRQEGSIERLVASLRAAVLEEGPAFQVPDRVQALIMSRLDTLPREARELTRAAAVLGERFDLPALQFLQAPLDERYLKEQIDGLVYRELVEPEAGVGQEFRFRHALIQEVAYESLPFARRRQLHQRAAAYLEDAHPDELEQYYGLLVHHCRRGGDRQRTLTYAGKAGDAASCVFANEEAISYYQTALAAAGDAAAPAAVISLLARLGDVRELTGAHGGAIEDYARAVEVLAERRLRRTGRARAAKRITPERLEEPVIPLRAAQRRHLSDLCRKIGYAYEKQSEYNLALDWLRVALLSLPARASAGRSRTCVAIAGVLFREGRLDEGEALCRRALAYARASRDEAALARAYKLLALISREKGAVPRAASYSRRALELYRRVGDLTGQADTLNNLGLDYSGLGEWGRAAECLEESLAVATRMGDANLAAVVHNNLGEVFLFRGETARARAEFRWTLEIAGKLGHAGLGALARANLGEALAAEGRLREGEQALLHSLSDFRRIDAQAFVSDVRVRLAEVLLSKGEGDRASRLAEEALAAAMQLDLRPVEAAALLLLGRISTSQGDLQAAISRLQRSRLLFRRAGLRHKEAKTLAVLGETYLERVREGGRQADRRRAEAALRAAAQAFEAMGAARDLPQATTLLDLVLAGRQQVKDAGAPGRPASRP